MHLTRKSAKKPIIFILISGLVSILAFVFISKIITNRQSNQPQEQKGFPWIYSYGAPGETQKSSKKETEKEERDLPENRKVNSEIPEKFLLDIPFYSQAPFANWDAVHEEMCEEAAILNAGLYLLDKKLALKDYEEELMKMKKIQKKEFGNYKSTTIKQTKKLVDIYFEGKIKSKIISNPTVKQIETEISNGNPIVVPLSGRDIGNPNFTPPGPIYHMLVIKGYDKLSFITNDVGTRNGNSYTYKKEIIMKNIHDWNEKDIRLGKKRVLVLHK